MKYVLEHCSWEMTRNCNMNCAHCCCGDKKNLTDQMLSPQKAVDVAHQIVEMGVKRVTLTGGEPFLREDWYEIANILSDGGVTVDLITNGTLICDEIVRHIQTAGITSVGVSLDGTRQTHDRLRCEGSYERCLAGVRQLVREKIPVTAVTTIQKINLGELDELADVLREERIKAWLLQLAMPFGNMKKNRDLMIEPNEIGKIIDFCFRQQRKKGLSIFMGDSIGYYTNKETIVRSRVLGVDTPVVWRGCPAGIHSLNIAYNGTILGISLCVDELRAGSLHKRSLKEIWNDDDAFAFRRKLDAKKFKGFCGTCRYVEMCLGGCLGMRYSTSGDIYGENLYCAYRNAVLGS